MYVQWTSRNVRSRKPRVILIFAFCRGRWRKTAGDELPTQPNPSSSSRSTTIPLLYSRQVSVERYRVPPTGWFYMCGWCRGVKDFTGPQPTDRPVVAGKTTACLTARKRPVRYYRGFSLYVLWALWKQIESEICSKLTNAGTGPKKPFVQSLLKKKIKKKRCNQGIYLVFASQNVNCV